MRVLGLVRPTFTKDRMNQNIIQNVTDRLQNSRLGTQAWCEGWKGGYHTRGRQLSRLRQFATWHEGETPCVEMHLMSCGLLSATNLASPGAARWPGKSRRSRLVTNASLSLIEASNLRSSLTSFWSGTDNGMAPCPC
jgi:hypothetical protein